MAYSARVFRVLIASPSDVEEERDAVVSVIQAWNDLHSRSREIVLLPLRWETHTAPEFGTRPQDVINRAIVDDCDLVEYFGPGLDHQAEKPIAEQLRRLSVPAAQTSQLCYIFLVLKSIHMI
jgi:hypothetical protein